MTSSKPDIVKDVGRILMSIKDEIAMINRQTKQIRGIKEEIEMDKQIGICDICLMPVYEHSSYVKACGVYAHAQCAENYGKAENHSGEYLLKNIGVN